MKLLCTNNLILIGNVRTSNIVVDISITRGRMNIVLTPTAFDTINFCTFTIVFPYSVHNLRHIKNCWFPAKYKTSKCFSCLDILYESNSYLPSASKIPNSLISVFFSPKLKAHNDIHISGLSHTCNILRKN